MLVIRCPERFEEAKDHARKVGLTSQFTKQLNFLRTYAQHKPGKPTVRVSLWQDFAPYSFSVLWERRNPDGSGEWKPWFNGGLIFHGAHDNGGDGGAPTYSVNITPQNGWSIHT